MRTKKQKIAMVTGVTGQDGAYLTSFLLEKGYAVHGLQRRSSTPNTANLDELLPGRCDQSFYFHHSDMTDTSSLTKLIGDIAPDEIYNLAAQSHVAVSFEVPEYTANSDALGVLRILEAIRTHDLVQKTKFYQASTSELYGASAESPQNEQTPFYPRSPYGVAKLYAYWITVNYREAYGMFACNGILFNHESPIRGENFVTRKITKGLCEIKEGLRETLYLGNLNAKRDWGHAQDYVEMQWRILQHKCPEDFIIATGVQYTIRQFVEKAARVLEIDISWVGEGENEKGIDQHGNCVIAVNPDLYRPTEVSSLLGDASKAKRLLGWEAKHTLEELVQEMVDADMKRVSIGRT